MTTPEDKLVSDLLDQARDAPRSASPDLLARVLADAEALQPRPQPDRAAGWLDRIGDALGGWPSFAGLATATVAGLWFGVAQPDTVDALMGGYLGVASEGSDLADALSAGDFLEAEVSP